MPTIPARSFAYQPLSAGQCIKVINTSGGQVVDTWAVSTAQPDSPFPRYMSMIHTRSSLSKLLPSINESFHDNKRDPILSIVEDTSPGIHDVVWAACSPERYQQLGASRDHDNCTNNLYRAVKELNHPSMGKLQEFLEYGWMPDPLNLFMNVVVSDDKVDILNPTSKPGDYITLRAEQDCVVFMSACPMDLNQCNRDGPTSADFEVV